MRGRSARARARRPPTATTLLYDTNNGSPYYDADGKGAGGAQLAATLATLPALTADDFLILAWSGQGRPHPVGRAADSPQPSTGTDIPRPVAHPISEQYSRQHRKAGDF